MLQFKLRPWSMDDVSSLTKHANNFNIAKYVRNRFPHPYSHTDGEKFIQSVLKKDAKNIFAIEVNSEAVGGIGLHAQDDTHIKNMELGYWLGEQYWGNGIVSRAVQQMIKYGFDTFDINRIFASTFHTNIGSQRVLEKTGFTLEGKFIQAVYKNGEYLDEWVYAVRRDNMQ